MIAGKRFNEEELDHLISNLPSVKFIGIQSNPQDFLAASDAFVLCSHAEGLSNALLEAMSTALPIVATRISGTENLIADGKNGILVPPKNVKALEEALVEVLKNPNASLGENARKRILEKYGFERVVAEYIRLYKHL